MHPLHRDIGLGKVERIYAFPSLNELTFAFAFGGGRYVLRMDGTENLRVALFAVEDAPFIRHVLVTPHGDVELKPGYECEVGEGVALAPCRDPVPQPELSEKEALRQCVYGNAVRAPDGTLYIPVNRAWVTMFGRMVGEREGFAGPVLFIWDAAFGSVLAARVNVDLALSNLRLLLQQLEEDGFFRQLRVGKLRNNLTGLPVVSLAVQAIYEQTRAREVLEEFYEPLLRANRWLERHRDKNNDGLLEWGYEEEGRGMRIEPRYAPAYESGLDDSPLWDDEVVDERLRCFTSSAVCLNALWAHECLLLAEWARLLGRGDEAAALRADGEGMFQRIDEMLWDTTRGIYANRRWDGRFVEDLAPTSFFPLLAGRPDNSRLAGLLRHLDDDRTFGGPWRLPSVARSSRRFSAMGDYWRGRIWPPLNFLALRGVARWNDKKAEALRENNRRLFMQEWLGHGHIHENYRSDTGWGEAPSTYARSCPFYTWGGLLLIE